MADPLLSVQAGLNRIAGTVGLSAQDALNRLAGTVGLDETNAWNRYAGTTGRTAQGAANVKAGLVGRTIQECVNALAAAPSFVPTDISGLVFWVSADSGAYTDAGTTLATNGQTVQQWNDRSTSAANASQATAGSRPTYQTGQVNSLPALTFDGAGDTIAISASIVQRHVFAVAKVGTLTDLQMLFGSPVGADVSVRVDSPSSNGYRGASNAVFPGDWSVFNESRFLVNGVNTNTIPAGFHVVESSKDTATAAQTLEVGGTAVSRFWNGQIAEFIMYSGQLSVGDASLVRGYLGTKYGITVV